MKTHTLALYFFIITSISHASDDNLHRYMWANYEQFSGKKEKAAHWYNQIFASRNYSVHTNKGYITLLSDTGNYPKIVELMPKVDELFSHDPDIQIIFVNALKKTGKTTEADDKLMRLSHNFKTHPEVIFHASEAYIKRKEMHNALSLIDDYLNATQRRSNHFIFYFLKSQIYTQLNEYPKALTNIQQCLKFHPKFPQGWLLLALIEEQVGKLDKAIEGYTSYLEIAGTNKQIEHHLIELAFKQKAAADHNKQVMLVNKTCLEKCLVLFERKQYKGALQQIDMCLANNETDEQLRLLKVQILSAMKNYDAVVEVLTTWSVRETNNQLWLQVLHLLPRVTHDRASVIAALEKIHAAHPKQLLPALYLADSYTRAGDDAHALIYHQKSLELTSDPAIKARVLFQIGLKQYEQKQFKEMLETLQQASAQKTSYPPILNLMAYYYATEKQEYAKAAALIESALDKDPHNPHFLDTKALILYKQRKYPEALAILESIKSKIPHDSTMLIHLAKTQHKMGNKDIALQIIADAQQYAHNNYEKITTSHLMTVWKQ